MFKCSFLKKKKIIPDPVPLALNVRDIHVEFDVRENSRVWRRVPAMVLVFISRESGIVKYARPR